MFEEGNSTGLAGDGISGLQYVCPRCRRRLLEAPRGLAQTQVACTSVYRIDAQWLCRSNRNK